MEELQPEELAWFLDDLHRPMYGRTSLMTQLAKASGYRQFLPFFDPFQFERDAREIAVKLPDKGEIVAVLYPNDRYSARLYMLRGGTAEPHIRYDRRRLGRRVWLHPGFQGLAGEPDLELEYQKDPAAREQFEKALALTAATALYRALGARSGGLYFMEKGWCTAFRLTQADLQPPERQEAIKPAHGI